jgi:hypothetical protein
LCQAKGLFGLHWKDGKRELSEDELGDLFGDELDTYLRWIKKKKGAKTERGKVRSRSSSCQTQTSACPKYYMEGKLAAGSGGGMEDGRGVSLTRFQPRLR